MRHKMPIRFTGFDWDEYNEEHILKHNVIPDEVETCFFNSYILKRKKRGKKRYYLYGQTDGGRALFIVFEVFELYKNGVVRPISARDMDPNEKRYFQRQKRG